MLKALLKISILLFILRSTLIIAQKNNLAGVYISADAFRSKAITYTKIVGEKYRFHLNNLFNKPYIKIIIGDSVYKLKKESLFGYRTKENIFFRLYNNEEYEIINPNEIILIYSKTFFTGYKTNQTTKYFFSVNSGSEIYPLTKFNLKYVTKNDSIFHEKLDLYFRSDEDLLEYDPFYNSYKLNKIKCK